MALVPNAKGLQLALDAGVKEISWVISVSESHNRSNVNRSVDESFRDFAAAWDGLGSDKPKLRLGLSTCFDCPWEGRVPEDDVIRAVERVIAAAPDVEIGICDTTGRAAPDHVGSLLARIMPRYASDRVTFAYHGHDTYGLGVANAIEAYRQGVRVIDGAAGGLGGCPFAPGAAGNTASEDLVFAFEHMGVKTGVDFKRLLVAADHVAAVEPSQAGGKLRTVPRKRALSGFGHATQGLRREQRSLAPELAQVRLGCLLVLEDAVELDADPLWGAPHDLGLVHDGAGGLDQQEFLRQRRGALHSQVRAGVGQIVDGAVDDEGAVPKDDLPLFETAVPLLGALVGYFFSHWVCPSDREDALPRYLRVARAVKNAREAAAWQLRIRLKIA